MPHSWCLCPACARPTTCSWGRRPSNDALLVLGKIKEYPKSPTGGRKEGGGCVERQWRAPKSRLNTHARTRREARFGRAWVVTPCVRHRSWERERKKAHTVGERANALVASRIFAITHPFPPKTARTQGERERKNDQVWGDKVHCCRPRPKSGPWPDFLLWGGFGFDFIGVTIFQSTYELTRQRCPNQRETKKSLGGKTASMQSGTEHLTHPCVTGLFWERVHSWIMFWICSSIRGLHCRHTLYVDGAHKGKIKLLFYRLHKTIG